MSNKWSTEFNYGKPCTATSYRPYISMYKNNWFKTNLISIRILNWNKYFEKNEHVKDLVLLTNIIHVLQKSPWMQLMMQWN